MAGAGTGGPPSGDMGHSSAGQVAGQVARQGKGGREDRGRDRGGGERGKRGKGPQQDAIDPGPYMKLLQVGGLWIAGMPKCAKVCLGGGGSYFLCIAATSNSTKWAL